MFRMFGQCMSQPRRRAGQHQENRAGAKKAPLSSRPQELPRKPSPGLTGQHHANFIRTLRASTPRQESGNKLGEAKYERSSSASLRHLGSKGNTVDEDAASQASTRMNSDSSPSPKSFDFSPWPTSPLGMTQEELDELSATAASEERLPRLRSLANCGTSPQQGGLTQEELDALCVTEHAAKRATATEEKVAAFSEKIVAAAPTAVREEKRPRLRRAGAHGGSAHQKQIRAERAKRKSADQGTQIS